MYAQPIDIWRQFTPEQKERVRNELSAIGQEVIYDYIRTHHNRSPDAQGDHLCAPVDSRMVKKLRPRLFPVEARRHLLIEYPSFDY